MQRKIEQWDLVPPEVTCEKELMPLRKEKLKNDLIATYGNSVFLNNNKQILPLQNLKEIEKTINEADKRLLSHKVPFSEAFTLLSQRMNHSKHINMYSSLSQSPTKNEFLPELKSVTDQNKKNMIIKLKSDLDEIAKTKILQTQWERKKTYAYFI